MTSDRRCKREDTNRFSFYYVMLSKKKQNKTAFNFLKKHHYLSESENDEADNTGSY